MRLCLVCGVLALALGVVGCGKEDTTVKVSGVLTWEDGTPSSQAQLEFLPEGDGKPATGFSDDKGRFELTTNHQGDGAIPGAYKVVVFKRDISKTINTGGPPE